jgi:16S rRNA (guanine527-N7)-methyltransferase
MRRPGITPETAQAIVARQPWDRISPLISRAGADATLVLPRLQQYAVAVVTWNASVSNLISKNDVARLVERHFVESLEPAALIKKSECLSFTDFGSGAGFPALPLALAGLGERWVLVETRRPKTLFLRKILQDLGLTNVAVVHDRLENVEGTASFDGFTARATERISPTLQAASKHVRPGGKAFLWKGSGWREEMKAANAWEQQWEFESSSPLSDPIVVLVFSRKSS